MRKRILDISVIIGLLIIIFSACLTYYKFSSQQIFRESSNHLEEIFLQVRRSFDGLLSRQWRNLEMWAPYLHDSNDEKTAAYLKTQQEKWDFTDFYFISHDGDYITIDGDSGYISLGSELATLVEKRENAVINVAIPNTPELMIFAVPTEKDTFRGFEYEIIAVGFNNSDIVAYLDVTVFDNQASSYVIYPNGRVMIDNLGKDDRRIYNFFAMLDEHSDLDSEQLTDLNCRIKNREQGVMLLDIDGIRHYLVYSPVESQNWTVTGLIPASIVNASLNSLQLTSLVVVISISAVVFYAVISVIVKKNRDAISQKDTELRYREELFSTLSDNVDDIFIMLDAASFKAEYISPNIDALLGISVKDARSNIRELYMPDSKDMYIDMNKGDKYEHEREYTNRRTGESRWFHVLAYRTEINGTDKYIFVLSDRTNEKNMTVTLKNALEIAKNANQSKSNFLANMSHDMRTPMNAIVGFCMLLERDADNPDKVRNYTKKIACSGKHLLGLISDVLDMSKIESGKTSLNLSEFCLTDIAEEILSIAQPQAKFKHQHFELRSKGYFPDKVIGDKTKINQILLNLISNAIKYTPDGGSIIFTGEGIDQRSVGRVRLKFTVEDNGCGMSSEYISDIFNPFSREVSKENLEAQGTGLGMAITKNIVDLMGGNITVESELGKGSIFTVELDLPVAGEKLDRDFWKKHGIVRMLAVDADERVSSDICNVMCGQGVYSDHAESGSDAVKMIREAAEKNEPFGIVLLSQKLPDGDGIETARLIRECMGENAPLIMLAAYDIPSIMENAKSQGIELFLSKPFFLYNFRYAVEEYFEKNSNAAVPKASGSNISIAGLHILIAEDNEINAEIISELMSMEGVSCDFVANGREALDKFSRSDEHEYDMIYMDIRMPVMDGYDAARSIRACTHPMAKNIPIIAMTANAFDEDINKSIQAGMNAHISKPIDMEKLKMITHRLMNTA